MHWYRDTLSPKITQQILITSWSLEHLCLQTVYWQHKKELDRVNWGTEVQYRPQPDIHKQIWIALNQLSLQSQFIDNTGKNVNLYISRIQVVVHRDREPQPSYSLKVSLKIKSLVAVWVIRLVKVIEVAEFIRTWCLLCIDPGAWPFNDYCWWGSLVSDHGPATLSVAVLLIVVGTVFPHLSQKSMLIVSSNWKNFPTWNLKSYVLSSSTKMRSHSTLALFFHIKMFSDPFWLWRILM